MYTCGKDGVHIPSNASACGVDGLYLPPSDCDACDAFLQELEDVKDNLDGKQDKLTAGDNITIVNNVISSTGGGGGDYTGGTGITIANKVISADRNPSNTYTKGEVDLIVGEKQDKLTAGNNIQINGNTISATDTTYSAGTGITITGNVIAATYDPITVDSALSNVSENPVQNKVIKSEVDGIKTNVATAQNDISDLDARVQDLEDGGCSCNYVAGDGIIITGNVISAEVTQQKLDDALDDLLEGAITGITITTPPTKTAYQSGDTLDLTGMVVSAVYANGRTQPISGYAASPANGATLTEANTSVAVSWTHDGVTYTASQAISVARILASIAVTQPTKATYTEGETLDLSGAVVTASFTSGATANVTSSATFSPANGATLSTVGTQTITAMYTEGGVTKAATTTVTVASATTVFQYSALLDLTKSDPDNIVTYTDDATGMTKGWAAWKNKDIFKDIKPCALKDGAVLYYLNPDNYAQKADGTTADITTLGNDVMIEIPKMGYAIEWQDSARTQLKVSVTNEPNASGFTYDAFSLDADNDCDKIYIGAYKGYVSGGKLYSSSGKAPTVNQTISTFRRYARARGTGYQQRTFGSLKLMQCLYIIAHGNLDSQTTVGAGYTASSNTAATNTGGADTLGFDFELASSAQKTGGTTQVKCLGLEDFWGNVWEWIDGLVSDASRNVMSAQYASQFNDAGTGYVNNGNGGVTTDTYGYMSHPQGGSGAGFVVRQASGSSSTYFADYAYLYASRVAYFGGYWSHTSHAGAFQLAVDAAASYASSNVGGRVIFMHKQS